MVHFLDTYFLYNQKPTWKRRKFQMPLSFNFHLTNTNCFKERWRFNLNSSRSFSFQYSLLKKLSFPLRISSVNVTTADLATYTEEILNGKLHFGVYTIVTIRGVFQNKSQTSNMELFAKTVNDGKPLTTWSEKTLTVLIFVGLTFRPL